MGLGLQWLSVEIILCPPSPGGYFQLKVLSFMESTIKEGFVMSDMQKIIIGG